MDQATQSTLVALSRLDGALGEMDRQIAAAPERIARFRARQDELRDRLAAGETELAAVTRKRRELESQAESFDGRIALFERQLLSIKANDDYQAMLRQIADTRQRVTEHENAVLELMEREEMLTARIVAQRETVADEVTGAAEEIARIEAELAGLERDRTARTAERERIVEHLDVETRRVYERIQRGRPGTAVVAVEKGACGGCHSALPPQRVNEARLGARLLTCEACGRIVVWDEENSSS